MDLLGSPGLTSPVAVSCEDCCELAMDSSKEKPCSLFMLFSILSMVFLSFTRTSIYLY